jgi:hypothetical protein
MHPDLQQEQPWNSAIEPFVTRTRQIERSSPVQFQNYMKIECPEQITNARKLALHNFSILPA